MRQSLWFVIPAHGRVPLARVCLSQLRRTCDVLSGYGIEASAVVIADDENLDTAAELGFWGYERPNQYLGLKFNDGYHLASREGVDFVVPCGSDDWIDYRLIVGAQLRRDQIRCARRLAMVAEDGHRYMRLRINYEGGIGLRIMPLELLQPLRYRPAEEDQKRGVDTVTLKRIKSANNFRPDLISYFDTDSDFQIVDFKTEGANLNTWAMCEIHGAGPEFDPWPSLLELYPDESVREIRALYGISA